MTTKRLILAINLLLVLPFLALSAERTVIVGFKQRPGRLEQSLVYGAASKVHRSHRLISAMTVTLSEEKIEELKKDARIAYVEENSVFTVAGQPLTAEELETMRKGGRIDPARANPPDATVRKPLTPEDIEDLRRGRRISYFDANGVYTPATDPLTAEEVENLAASRPVTYAGEFAAYSMAAEPAASRERGKMPPTTASSLSGRTSAPAPAGGLRGPVGSNAVGSGTTEAAAARDFNFEGIGSSAAGGRIGYAPRNAIEAAVPRAFARQETAGSRNDRRIAHVPRDTGYAEIAAPPAVQENRGPARDMQAASAGAEALYTYSTLTLIGTELENSWGVAHIDADIPHTAGNKGAGIKIAVLDTGIDYNHPDLDDNYAGGYDFISDPNDNDPFDDNFFGHGTHVAGILAAEDNGTGVVGVAPAAEILAVKVLDGGGFGTAEGIVEGIGWAVANGAQIINMSIQGPENQAVEEACQAAYDAGVLLVAAGGNSHTGGTPVTYPAAYDTVIAVTALDSADTPGYFAPIDNAVELAAPGVSIISTVLDGNYDSIDGTSQAAPHVSGTAALYMAVNTEDRTGDGLVNHKDVRRLLELTATDLGDAGRDEVYGIGMVSAALAFAGAEIDNGGNGNDDTAGFTITEEGAATSVAESGTTDTFDVVLDVAPLTDVVILVTSGDTGEATVNQASLTFTSANWDTAQTVTVTGVDDAIVDGSQTTTITLSIDDANSDDAFDLLADQTVLATTTDDDSSGGGNDETAGFTVTEEGGATSVAESGTTDTFDVVLDAAPLTDVVILVTSGDSGEATVNQASLTFTPANWDTAQTVTVTGVDDAIVDGTQTTTITLSIDDANSDEAFDLLADQTVLATTTDDDTDGGNDHDDDCCCDCCNGGGNNDGGIDNGDYDGGHDPIHGIHVHDMIHDILYGRIPDNVHDMLHDIFYKNLHNEVPANVHDRIHQIYQGDGN